VSRSRCALRSWIATVAITEVGFEGVSEDWWHELWAREYLAELRERAGTDWPERWDGLIAPWDERFRAATVEVWFKWTLCGFRCSVTEIVPHASRRKARKTGLSWRRRESNPRPQPHRHELLQAYLTV
jgi:hypothetical protein